MTTYQPRHSDQSRAAKALCAVRDTQARFGGYLYTPRHSAEVKGGAA